MSILKTDSIGLLRVVTQGDGNNNSHVFVDGGEIAATKVVMVIEPRVPNKVIVTGLQAQEQATFYGISKERYDILIALAETAGAISDDVLADMGERVLPESVHNLLRRLQEFRKLS